MPPYKLEVPGVNKSNSRPEIHSLRFDLYSDLPTSGLLFPARSVVPLEDAFAVEIGGQGAGLPDLVLRAGQEVAVDDDEVGLLALLERADPVLQEQQVGVVDGVEPDRLLAGQGLLGVEPALVALGLAG